MTWEGSQLERLVSLGLTVYAIDLPGHGQSDGEPRAHFAHFDDLPNAVLQFCREHVVPEAAARALPLFLYGQSMGGTTVLRAAQLASESTLGYPIAGMVCSAAAISSERLKRQVPRALQLVVSLAAWFSPESQSAIASGPNGIDPAAYARELATEPTHYHGNPTWGLVSEILRVTSGFMKDGGAHALQAVCVRSLLAIHSRTDSLTEWEGSVALFDRAVASRKCLVLLRGVRGEVAGEVRCEMGGQPAPDSARPWHASMLDLPLWHNLTREPGGEALADAIARWVQQEALQCRRQDVYT